MALIYEYPWLFSLILSLLFLCFGYYLAKLKFSNVLRTVHQDQSYLTKEIQTLQDIIQDREEELSWHRSELMSVREKNAAAEEKIKIFEDYQKKSEELSRALAESDRQCAELSTSLIREREGYAEKLALISDAQKKMEDAFKALSFEALEKNNQHFLSLAQQSFEKLQESAKGDLNLKEKAIAEMVSPLRESLRGVDHKLQELEKERGAAFQVLRHQVGDLILSQKELKSETANLVRALRTPHVRGRWGEMQLRRVAEISGMNAYCDFVEQSHRVQDMRVIRPDMIVNLPEGKRIIVDAKAPLQAYLESVEARSEQERTELLRAHARQVKTHINALSSKNYWDQFSAGETPEFVILFLPGEAFFSAALEQETGLIEMAAEKKVILATPTTLIALLQAIAYGWRQERIAKNAQEISQIGKELYKRFHDLSKHLLRLGQDLTSSVNAYNKTVGTFESRFLPSARRFKDLGIGGDEQNVELPTVEVSPRQLKTLEIKSREDEHQKLSALISNP